MTAVFSQISVTASLAVGLVFVSASVGSAQQPVRLLNAACTAGTEQVTEPKTGRSFLLDYPCDQKAGEKVTFILSLHGGGSSGTWQRRYFPAFEQKEQHRLVIAAPYSPTRNCFFSCARPVHTESRHRKTRKMLLRCIITEVRRPSGHHPGWCVVRHR